MQKNSAKEILEEFVESAKKRFGNKVEDFSLLFVTDIPYKMFGIKFRAYKFYVVYLNYDGGFFGCCIATGGKGVGLDSNINCDGDINLDYYWADIDEQIRLRIPDKFLDKKGWLQIETTKYPRIRNISREESCMQKNSAKERAREFIDSAEKYFGKKVDCLEYSAADEPYITFNIIFRLYDFYIIVLNYDKGHFACSISFGKDTIPLESSIEWDNDINLDNYWADIDEQIRLRIPDKYLDKYGWL